MAVPMFLYGCEVWVLTRDDVSCSKEAQMKYLRAMNERTQMGGQTSQ